MFIMNKIKLILKDMISNLIREIGLLTALIGSFLISTRFDSILIGVVVFIISVGVVFFIENMLSND